ncbi:TadE/TadG family type IV pilus assembly protein [Haematomicrobium sanguinis]|uniref:TadE/TadG family type IV pilus assembly protein n=1 Tax=Haematomicrobium sanguinis TaxID=479106 RepID=UPI00068F5C27|nr:TadE/TadG family type IV pilus assembly protein [Haematomicrobium sanguinis]
MTRRERTDERGSAPVEFVLIGTVLIVLFLAIIQLALALHVRNTLIDAASSGARLASLADRTEYDGVDRTKSLITSRLSSRFANDVTVATQNIDGAKTVVVTVRTSLPLFGYFGPNNALEVTGHAPAG